jgi:hypothetical protein
MIIGLDRNVSQPWLFATLESRPVPRSDSGRDARRHGRRDHVQLRVFRAGSPLPDSPRVIHAATGSGDEVRVARGTDHPSPGTGRADTFMRKFAKNGSRSCHTCVGSKITDIGRLQLGKRAILARPDSDGGGSAVERAESPGRSLKPQDSCDHHRFIEGKSLSHQTRLFNEMFLAVRFKRGGSPAILEFPSISRGSFRMILPA